jgi:thymidylate synthase
MVVEGSSVKPRFWQATDVSARPEAQMREITFHDFSAPIPPNQFAAETQTKPNMPWAEDHFEERVGGEPVNPGTTWTAWPWSNSADTHRTDGKFNHNYMERYWPKYANDSVTPLHGIRYDYGDLNDVVKLIANDPLTRQAYLPVFFPEDTGGVHGGRMPCSIGYHFMIRDNKLNVVYQLRSCDLFRHFRDDIYLTVRLAQWIKDSLFLEHKVSVGLGNFYMVISSLHLFINDYYALTSRLSKDRD